MASRRRTNPPSGIIRQRKRRFRSEPLESRLLLAAMLPSEAGPLGNDAAAGVVQTDTLNMRVQSIPQQTAIDSTLTGAATVGSDFTSDTTWQLEAQVAGARSSDLFVSARSSTAPTSTLDSTPVDNTPQAPSSGQVATTAAKDWAALIQQAMFPTHPLKRATIRTAAVDPVANFESGRLSNSFRPLGGETVGPSGFMLTDGLLDTGAGDPLTTTFDAAAPVDLPVTSSPASGTTQSGFTQSNTLQGGPAADTDGGSVLLNSGGAEDTGTTVTGSSSGSGGEVMTFSTANAPDGFVEQSLAVPTSFSSANARMLRNYAIAPITLETASAPQVTVADAMPSVSTRALDLQYVANTPSAEEVHTFHAAVVPISNMGFQSMIEPTATTGTPARVAQHHAAVDLQFANLDAESDVLGDLISDLLAPGVEFPTAEEVEAKQEEIIVEPVPTEPVDDALKVSDSWSSGIRIESIIASLGGAMGAAALNRRLTPTEEL